MKETYYMAVTADKYELPICICESGTELANIMGVDPNTVFSSIKLRKNGKRTGYKYIKVEINENV